MIPKVHKTLSILILITGTFHVTAQIKPPVVENDYTSTYVECPVTVNVLANDYCQYGHPMDLFFVGSPQHGIRTVDDSCITYTSFFYFSGTDSIKYIIRDMENGMLSEGGYLYIEVNNNNFDYLDINNYSARINAYGNHFWDFQVHDIDHPLHILEIPRDSRKGTIIRSSLWIGAQDASNNIHIAAENNRNYPYWQDLVKKDFWSGPCMDSIYYSNKLDSIWNRVWKLNRTDIEYHKSHWWETGYLPIDKILSWPGNGDTSLGQSFQLAPYHDRNQNEIYEPLKGDYPKIRGDQSVFFIFNDDRDYHLHTYGEKLKVEIHGWAYAFDCLEDSAFNNTLFFHYDIYNRSSNEYHDTFLGIQTDFDVGDWSDDFIACDVYRNTIYGYNGNPVDGTGNIYEYGAHPPAQSTTILSGPLMDPDDIDNPKVNFNGQPLCDESYNGLNFGDGIIDNELFGITSSFSGGYRNPYSFVYWYYEYYNIMKGIWNDSTFFNYGGNGHPEGNAYGPECKFIYPGLSDSLNWGIGCQEPFGPTNWTMETAGIEPYDISGGIFSGPFTFKPGDKQELDFAYVFGRDYVNPDPHAAITVMNERIDVIREAFLNDTTPCGGSFSGVRSSIAQDIQIKIYPNPANETVTISLKSDREYPRLELQCFDLIGRVVYESNFHTCQQLVSINVSSWPQGLYVVVILDYGMMIGREKFVVLR